MTYFADLSPCTYSSDRFVEDPLAVGWLEGEDYSRGEVSPERVHKLLRIHQDSPFQKDLHYRGMHPCPFCGHQGMTDTEFGSFAVGARTILVPGVEVLYYSPSTILHYIIDHGYSPPEVFLQAVDTADLTDFGFVDQVARTLMLRSWPRDTYAERVGDLLVTWHDLMSVMELQSAKWEIMKEEIPGNASSRPEGVADVTVARIEARLAPLRKRALKEFAAAAAVHEGTKWYPALQEYASRYEAVKAPAANL